MDINLILFKKDGTHKSFSLPSNITVIGRRHDCDLRVPLKDVSRRHCQLNCNKDTLKIHDLGSRNGTYLNGKRIDEATVKPGDYLKIGPLTFLFQIDGQPKQIATPQRAVQKPPKPEKPPAKVAEEEESFPELELELEPDESESDSFLAELEDL